MRESVELGTDAFYQIWREPSQNVVEHLVEIHLKPLGQSPDRDDLGENLFVAHNSCFTHEYR